MHHHPRSLCDAGDERWAVLGPSALRRSWFVHNPQALLPPPTSSKHPLRRKRPPAVKFRCERDTLVEALGAAGRAVANRGGALPVLAGVRAELTGNRLRLTGSDLELTIEIEITVAGEDDGVAVLPAK